MKVLSVGAGTSGNIKLSYTPEFIGVKIPTGAVLGRITGTREGTGTILNLDGKGVQIFGQGLRATAQAPDSSVLLVPTANGFINGGFFLECSNTGTGTIEVFAFSTKKGTAFVSSIIDTAVQNTSTRYEKFLRLASASTLNGDIITHFYNLDESNTAVLVTADEVRAVTAVNCNNSIGGAIDSTTQWDNTSQEYKAVVIQPSANVTMFVQRIVM